MSFDALAPHYRWMEWALAQGKLQRCRTAFLPQVQRAKSALLLGEGNGRFLSELLKGSHPMQIVCLDSSLGMLERARARVSRQAASKHSVTFIHQDILQWSPPRQEFDLLVTDFFLDCFQPKELQGMIARLAAAAKPGAQWLLADFQVPEILWQKWRARCILFLMYWFFRRTTHISAHSLPAPDIWMQKNGFRLRQRCQFEWDLLKSELWDRL